jgi:probable phosphoglycerate mutase
MQGHGDSALTSRGAAQAREVGCALRGLIDDPLEYALWASPLGRARQTAVIVSEMLGCEHRSFRYDEAIKEMCFGDWEGLTAEEIAQKAPDCWAQRKREKWSFVPPGGESYAMLAKRGRRWLETVAGEPRLIVVTHGNFGRVLRGIYLDLTPAETLALDGPHDALFRLRLGEVARFDVSGAGPSARG